MTCSPCLVIRLLTLACVVAMLIIAQGCEESSESLSVTTTRMAPPVMVSMPAVAPTTAEDETLVVLEVHGMDCAGCEAAVREVLAGGEGVVRVNVSRQASRAWIVAKQDKPVDAQALATRVGSMGDGSRYRVALVTERVVE